MIGAVLIGGALAGVVEAPGAAQGLHDADAPRRVALLVGIDEYADGALQDLRYAAKDAADLAAVLRAPDLGAFDEVILLTGSPDRDVLLDELDALSGRLVRDDLLLVYFAGHGTIDLSQGETQLYLMPADGELARPRATGLGLSELERRLQAMPPRRRVLIVDACHAGSGRSGLSPEIRVRLDGMRGDAPLPELMAIGRHDARLFAARLHDPALEDDRLGNGVYTHFLLRALRGEGDLDGDGVVDVIEAHQWTRDRTLRYTDGLQVPWLRVSEEGRVPILLSGTDDSRTDAVHAVLADLQSLPVNTRIRVDGEARGGGSVAAGRRRIQVDREGTVLLDRSVYLSPGERLDVSHLIAQRGRHWTVGAGAGWVGAEPDGEPLLAPLTGHLGAWWWPTDPGGARLALGATGSASFGEIADIGQLPGGTVAASGAWMWGGDSRLGLRLDAGLLWRLPFSGPQATPMVRPQVWLMHEAGGYFVSMTAGAVAPLAEIDGVRRTLPETGVNIGMRL